MRRIPIYALSLIAACIIMNPVQAIRADMDQAEADTTSVVRQEEKSAFVAVIDYMTELFDVSMRNIKEKALRILVIVLICIVARLVMKVVQAIGYFMVYSEWGPLRYVFRDHQRSITVQALIINLVKYIVYFTALGYILNELGIDYKTYLASLSLIGIAIGFGSQGLVQDVVTGFFILFENQFVVGDMVEIAGQTGIVEEIGLRTTRLRNYLGGVMIFPNRNIAVVGRYEKGGMEFNVDVAVPQADRVEAGADLLQRIGDELSKQFDDVILDEPEVIGVITLATGETFLRLYGRIWPAQQWVVDAQMVPRIRELFKQGGIEIPGDRIVVFYHLPTKEEKVQPALHRLRRIVRETVDRFDDDDAKLTD